MKRLFFFALLLGLGLSGAFAQTISNVDLTKVYSGIADEASPFFYPPLLERYKAHDSSLTVFDYHYLYYGYTKQDGYNPYARGEGEKVAMQMVDEGKLEEARLVLLTEFEENPFNMNVIFRLGSLADMQQKPAEARQWLLKFDGLLRTILQSGDGQSEETALVVIAPQDEYPIMGVLGLETTGQGLVKNKYDVQKLKTPNEMESEKLYFNIEMPFGHMARTFTQKIVKAESRPKPVKAKKMRGTAGN
ncbi:MULTISPECIES: DUF4919 domain-containing protein [Rufibacter]|uniref:DUF4919 domain-containing protein n=1 Tax=Rufibacter quisquiliarum TaxID=1549639 RepID=A0A839GPY2_9BACT|nr:MULTISPECIES: DUF4919 domain-containing protein [Rufibacter]MBA9078839.1 hypothetical protein [Rufibacter quisquiliarum]